MVFFRNKSYGCGTDGFLERTPPGGPLLDDGPAPRHGRGIDQLLEAKGRGDSTIVSISTSS